MALNKTRERILLAIPSDVVDDEWAAPAAVADVLSLSVKTVREHLNALTRDGYAEDAKDANGVKIYRAVSANIPVEVSAEGEPAESAAEATDTPVEAAAPDTDGSAGTDELSAVLGGMEAARPGVAAALAAPPAPAPTGNCTFAGCGQPISKAGRSWEHTAPVPDGVAEHKATTRAARQQAEPKTGTCTFAGCGGAIVKDGRSWRHLDDNGAPLPAGALSHDATTRAARPAGTGTQNRTFKPGELRDKVLAHLRTLPEGVSVAPKDVAKTVGATASSANYALNLLAGTGEATVVNVDGRMQFRAS